MLTQERKNETRIVKQTLKSAGYPVKSVCRGKGTARCWIEIKIDTDWQSLNGIRSEIEILAAKTIGRTDWPDNLIQVTN